MKNLKLKAPAAIVLGLVSSLASALEYGAFYARDENKFYNEQDWSPIINGDNYNSAFATAYGHNLFVDANSLKFSFNSNGRDRYDRYGMLTDEGGLIKIGNTKPLGNLEINIKTTSSKEFKQQAYGMATTPYNGKGGHIDISAKDVSINVTSDYFAHGLWAYNNSTPDKNVPEEDKSSIVINAGQTTIDVAAPEGQSNGIIAWSEGKVNIDGSLTIRTWNSDRSELGVGNIINTRGNSVIKINEKADPNAMVQLDGAVLFEYASSSKTPIDSTVVINLTNPNSYWKGSLKTNYNGFDPNKPSLLEVSRMKLGLSNGAQWTPTQIDEIDESNPDSGTISGTFKLDLPKLEINGGIVNITDSDIDVTVTKVSGTGGTVNLATDLKEQKGQQAGKFNVVEADNNTILAVALKDQTLSRSLTADEITPAQAAELKQNVGGNNDQGKPTVATTVNVPEGMVKPAFGIDKQGQSHQASANTLMQSSLELASAAPLALSRIMMTDVRKRLGDIRSTEGTHGAWARYDGGKLTGEGGLKNDFNTIQMGIDTVPLPDAARMGVAFSYTNSDAEYARGDADMKAYSISMYGTKMYDNGMFFDVIGRMGTADTDLVVDGKHKGTMDNVVLGVSGEMGWRFNLADTIYIEPQAEVAYTYVNGDNLKLGSASYEVDSVNSLMGRLGFAAGLKCPADKGNVYVRASAVHEFLGDARISGENLGVKDSYEIDGKDTWVEYGLGANLNVTKSTYVWADVERTTGGALDEDWRATVGVRYAW